MQSACLYWIYKIEEYSPVSLADLLATAGSHASPETPKEGSQEPSSLGLGFLPLLLLLVIIDKGKGSFEVGRGGGDRGGKVTGDDGPDVPLFHRLHPLPDLEWVEINRVGKNLRRSARLQYRASKGREERNFVDREVRRGIGMPPTL